MKANKFQTTLSFAVLFFQSSDKSNECEWETMQWKRSKNSAHTVDGSAENRRKTRSEEKHWQRKHRWIFSSSWLHRIVIECVFRWFPFILLLLFFATTSDSLESSRFQGDCLFFRLRNVRGARPSQLHSDIITTAIGFLNYYECDAEEWRMSAFEKLTAPKFAVNFNEQ